MSQERMHHLVFEICVGIVLLHMALSACIIPKRTIPNGSIRYHRRRDLKSTQVQEAHILRFRCNRGYTRVGPRVILCENGEWTAQVPQCVKMECEEPPSISNGKYTVKTSEDGRKVIGSTATYTCDAGFEIENDTSAVLTCELDLKTNDIHWSNPTPRCKKKKSCPDPGVSVDGARKGNCCFVGDVLMYSCKEGFELVGIDTLVCLPTGNWSAPRPLCRPLSDHCSSPPSITHGSVIGDKEGDFYLPYDEVEITCEPGFEYQGYEFNLCLEEIGWEETFSECKEIFCDQPEPLVNGSIPELQSTNMKAFPYNFEITYVCNEGYRLIGDSWRLCSENGWSGDTPYCEEIRCPDPGVPEHGLSSSRSLKIGSEVAFHCLAGYNLIGSSKIYCMPNGEWNGEVARCDSKDNYCPDPGTPVNGMKNNSYYVMGSKIQCRPGYAFMGSDVIECLPNRTWSAKEIKCIGWRKRAWGKNWSFDVRF
ncbi:CUB and sushi domain-containing protein 3-like [Stegodyphus dumicola]|uniref:CUB and sushi domain-containing protein 3-like n=1 Tax=Stegodyphus dumicola TaxID=202533 RepID=UPI0015AAEFD6|nr:CUB and sushi domain-containing protein 3-like [Stegodyphus dumicola]